MEKKEVIKEYSNGDVTVVWKPNKCIHAAVCVNTLPKVYKPNEKPWIQAENASGEELKAQINKCPSGALSYYSNVQADKVPDTSKINISVMANGPLIVNGHCEITNVDGTTSSQNKKTAFCRCGGSSNKPFCDGSHVKIGFKD